MQQRARNHLCLVEQQEQEQEQEEQGESIDTLACHKQAHQQDAAAPFASATPACAEAAPAAAAAALLPKATGPAPDTGAHPQQHPPGLDTPADHTAAFEACSGPLPRPGTDPGTISLLDSCGDYRGTHSELETAEAAMAAVCSDVAAAAAAAAAAFPLPQDIMSEVLQRLELQDLAHAMQACQALLAAALATPQLWSCRFVHLQYPHQPLPRYAAAATVALPYMPTLVSSLRRQPHLQLRTLVIQECAPRRAGLSSEQVAQLVVAASRLEKLSVAFRCFSGRGAFRHLAGLSGLQELHFGGENGFQAGDAAHLAQLRRLTALVIVQNRALTSEGVAHLAQLRDLQALSLCYMPRALHHDAGLGAVLRNCRALRSLALPGCGLRYVLSPAVWQLLGSLSGLTEANLSDNQLTDVEAAGLASLSSLTLLDVSRNRLTHMGFLAGLRQLQSLDAMHNLTMTDLQGLGAATGLTTLTLSYEGDRDAAPPGTTACVSRLTGLRLLMLSGMPRPAELLSHLQPLSGLLSLYLLGCGLGHQHLSQQPLPCLGRLSCLELRGNPGMEPAGLPPQVLDRLTSLTHLDLSECSLKGCAAAGLSRLVTLASLSLAGNAWLGLAGSDAGMDATVSALVEEEGELIDLTPLTRLTWLDLEACYLPQPLPRLPASLRALRLDRCHRLGVQGVADMAGGLTGLTRLSCRSMGLSSRHGQAAPLVDLPAGLKDLVLAGNPELGDAAVRHLRALSKLTSLDMHSCGLTEWGVELLRDLSGSLAWLDARGNPGWHRDLGWADEVDGKEEGGDGLEDLGAGSGDEEEEEEEEGGEGLGVSIELLAMLQAEIEQAETMLALSTGMLGAMFGGLGGLGGHVPGEEEESDTDNDEEYGDEYHPDLPDAGTVNLSDDSSVDSD